MGKVRVKTTFALAGEGEFEGWHDPDYRWNGFAVPFFPMDEVERIAELVQRMNSTDQPSWVLPLAHGLVVVRETDVDGSTYDTDCPTEVFGDEIGYLVGDGWCWEEV